MIYLYYLAQIKITEQQDQIHLHYEYNDKII